MAKHPNKILFNDEVLLDLTEDTVTSDVVRKGYKGHNAQGESFEGTFDPYKGSNVHSFALLEGYSAYNEGGVFMTGNIKNYTGNVLYPLLTYQINERNAEVIECYDGRKYYGAICSLTMPNYISLTGTYTDSIFDLNWLMAKLFNHGTVEISNGKLRINKPTDDSIPYKLFYIGHGRDYIEMPIPNMLMEKSALISDTVTPYELLSGVTAHNASGEQITGNIPLQTSLHPSDFEFGEIQTIEDSGVEIHYYPMAPNTKMCINTDTFTQCISVQEVINILQNYISPTIENGMIVYDASVFQGAINTFFMRLDSSNLSVKIPDGLVNAEELLSKVNVTASQMLKGTIAVDRNGNEIEGSLEIPTFSTIRTVSSERQVDDSIGIDGDIIMVVSE